MEPTYSDIRFLFLDGYQPMPLSAIYDELGTVYAEFDYDASGRATSTQHAGGVQRWKLTYPSSPGEPTRVEDPLGSVYLYQYETQGGRGQLSSASQPGGSGCDPATASATYTETGLVSSRTDFKGAKTCYAYDAQRGLERYRLEGVEAGQSCPSDLENWSAVSGSAQRKISTQWHPQWHMPVSISEPGKRTVLVYNGQPVGGVNGGGPIATCAPADALVDGKPLPVVCVRTEFATGDESGAQGESAAATGASRQWRYTYDRYGRVLRTDGPRQDAADTVSMRYYPATDAMVGRRGALESVTNAAGHVTRFTAYDEAGRLLRMEDPNGVATSYGYDVRGRVKSVQRTAGGQSRTTLIEYRPNGQVQRVTQPDGSYVQFGYDAARRLNSVTDGAGNAVYYGLDQAGNRTEERYVDASGTLKQRVNRVFDALNRLQAVSGARQ